MGHPEEDGLIECGSIAHCSLLSLSFHQSRECGRSGTPAPAMQSKRVASLTVCTDSYSYRLADLPFYSVQASVLVCDSDVYIQLYCIYTCIYAYIQPLFSRYAYFGNHTLFGGEPLLLRAIKTEIRRGRT